MVSVPWRMTKPSKLSYSSAMTRAILFQSATVMFDESSSGDVSRSSQSGMPSARS